MVNAIEGNCRWLGHNKTLTTAKFTADSGFHSEKNLESLLALNMDAYIADNQFRKRDPDFDHAGRYKIQHKKIGQRSQKSREKQRPVVGSERMISSLIFR